MSRPDYHILRLRDVPTLAQIDDDPTLMAKLGQHELLVLFGRLMALAEAARQRLTLLAGASHAKQAMPEVPHVLTLEETATLMRMTPKQLRIRIKRDPAVAALRVETGHRGQFFLEARVREFLERR